MFIGREKEFKVIEEKISSSKFELGIIYGRRRIGKTRLLREVLEVKKGIYFVASEMSYEHNIYSLSQIIASFYGEPVSFTTLEDIFKYLESKSIRERVVLVIDEFTYLFGNNTGIQSLFQGIVDSLNKANMCLILSGSQIGMIEEMVTYKKPLYGRATFKLKLEAFDYYESALFYPKFKNEDKIVLYSVFGGIPHYLSLIDNKKSVKENIIDLVVSNSGALHNEIDFIISQELRSVSTYKMILDAISSGATRLNDISNKGNIKNTGNTVTYLKTLINLELVKKEVPFGENENSKKTLYKIKDNLVSFSYTFISKNRSALAIMNEEIFYENFIEKELNKYVSRVFEKVCAEFLIRKNKEKKQDVFYQIGRYWGNNPLLKIEVELDVLASNREGIIVFECKWTKKPFSDREFDVLKSHSLHLKPIKFGAFSLSGFTSKAKGLLDYSYNLADLF